MSESPSLEAAAQQSSKRIVQASNGNTPWAQNYASLLRETVIRRASRQDRNVQRRLGPSELDHACDRQIIGKMAGARTDKERPEGDNHISDPWASIMGTAGHAWMEDCFNWDNENGPIKKRWATERKVTPDPGSETPHPGTADLFDFTTNTLTDFKFQSESVRDGLRRNGPPQHYFGQMLLYAVGYMHENYPVERVALVSWPRTKSSMDDMYVWEHVITEADIQYVIDLIERTKVREEVSKYVASGELDLYDIPMTPVDASCHYCLSGDTEVVTRDGLKAIRSLAGTAPEVLVPSTHNGVLTSRGSFLEAPVRYFGEQETFEITLTRNRAKKVIRATADHRWVTERRSHGIWKQVQVTTADLRPGDTLKSLKRTGCSQVQQMNIAVSQGFTFGDGTNNSGERPGSVMIYDNGKDDAMLKYFDGYTQQSAGKLVYGLPRTWKSLPDIRDSRSFLVSWLSGYFAADGHVTKAGQCSISSASLEAVNFVRDVAAVCGIGYGPVQTKMRKGFPDREPSALHTLHLNRRDFPAWFFHIEEHAVRAMVSDEKAAKSTLRWKVASIIPTGVTEPVYCATVEGTEAFGLSDDLMTRNCPFYRPQAAYDKTVTGCPGTVEVRS